MRDRVLLFVHIILYGIVFSLTAAAGEASLIIPKNEGFPSHADFITNLELLIQIISTNGYDVDDYALQKVMSSDQADFTAHYLLGEDATLQITLAPHQSDQIVSITYFLTPQERVDGVLAFAHMSLLLQAIDPMLFPSMDAVSEIGLFQSDRLNENPPVEHKNAIYTVISNDTGFGLEITPINHN